MRVPLVLLLIVSISSFAFADEPLIESSLDTLTSGWSKLMDSYQKIKGSFRELRSAAIEREGETLDSAGSQPSATVDDGIRSGDSGSAKRSEKDENPDVVIVDKGSEREVNRDMDGGFGGPGPVWPFRRDNPWIFRGIDSIFTQFRPWWKGPNICIERQVIEETPESEDNSTSAKTLTSLLPFTLQSTQCSESETAYVCTTRIRSNHESKTQTVKYQCCHGFKRAEGKSECLEVDLKNITATLHDIGAKKMENLFIRSTFMKRSGSENVTIFSPSDEAMMDFEDDKNKQMNEIPAVDSSDSGMADLDANDITSHHMISGLYRTGDFKNNMIIPTLNNETTIRINIYDFPQRVITANCAPILMPNNYASNAVIHVVSRLIPKPKTSLLQVLENESRFSTFLKFLRKSEFFAELRDANSSITVLAPTNEAFQKLDPQILRRLDSASSCYDTIIANHIIPNVVCSSAVGNMYWHRSKANNRLTFTRTDNKLFVDELPTEGEEILGLNGVVYMMNDVLVPENAKPLSGNLDSRLTSDFFKLVKESGLMSEWDTLENITLIAPTNNAFKKLSEAEVAMLANNSNILNYHIAKSMVTSSNFFNNKVLTTLSDHKLRLNVVEEIPGIISRPTIQCARIVNFNKNMCSGSILMVDSVLKPPKSNIIEALDSMEGFSIFNSLIRNSSFADKLRDESGPFTVLAVDDDSLKRQLTVKELDDIKSDRAKAERLLQKHIMPEMVCCSSISQTGLILNFQRFRLMDSSTLNAHRDLHGRIKFWASSMNGMATVNKCDNMAENGVVHVINRAIQPSSSTTLENNFASRVPNIPMIIQGFLHA